MLSALSVRAAGTVAAVVTLLASSSLLLPVPVLAVQREISEDLKQHRRKLWDIAEREKMLADPRGLHRERLRQEGERKIRERGIFINPDYHWQRRQIDVSSRHYYPNKLKEKLQDLVKTEEEKKMDEEVAFWERLLEGHLELSITGAPTKAPTPPLTPEPTAAPSPAPITSTPAPTPPPTAVPTSSPVATPNPTKAPVVTPSPTPAPIIVTPAPVAPTPSPVAPTPAPVATTPAPVATTPAPVPPTPAPVATTPAPVATTPAPVATTPAPVATTPAPVVTTPAPVVTTPAPVVTTPAPVATTPAPVMAPVATPTPTMAPIETPAPTMAPVAATPTPTMAPVETPAPTMAPVVATATPTMAPVETPAPTMAPVMATATPTAAPVATPEPTQAPVAITPPTQTPVAIAPPTTAPIPGTAPPTPGSGECAVTDLILSVALQGGAEFVDPASYQSKALDWLCGSDLTGLSDARIVQRYSLASIYYATYEVKTVFTDAIFGGAIFPWLDNTNWVTNANECTWVRIGCNDAGLVNVIDLFKNIVTGEFPGEVALLSDSLEIFDIGDNPVFTEGDTFNQYLGQLSKLTDLRYDQTNFINTNGVPVELGSLKALQFYSCAQVLYSGALQEAAFQSDQANLEFLEIEFNSYNSSVPASVASLPKLTRFYARDSFLEGNLDWMQNMKSIFELWVDINPGLSGTLPTFLGTLSTLGSFSVTESAFTGPIPTEIGLLSATMQRLFMYDNALTGGVPTEFGNLQKMDFLQVENNDLTIEMPSQVCVLTFGPLEVLTADCVICPTTPCCTECF